MSPALLFYEGKINDYTARLQALQKRLTLIYLLRIISFLGLAVTAWYLLRGLSYPLLTVSILFLIAFIALVVLNLRLKDQRTLLERLLFLNRNELGVLNNELNGFPDGRPFLSSESYLDDLDIFGRRSLFHLLNRTTSSHGTARLADMLRTPLFSKENIRQQQQALQILAGQAETRQLITAHGLLAGETEGNLHDLAAWLKTPNRLKRWVHTGRWLIVVYNISALIFLFYTGNYRLLLIGIIAGWILTGFFADYIAQQHQLLSKKNSILEQYALTLRLFNTMDNGKAPLLEQLQTKTSKAHSAIRRLAGISSYFDQQLNPMVSFILNNLFVYNLHGLIALEKWKDNNRLAFPEWIEAVGYVECLNSLAAFAFNNPGYCYPLPSESSAGRLFITARQLGHPLIPAKENVPNDCNIGNNESLILVTGSNMSGKTTFLRTIGVNLLLAQCGAPVNAVAFSFTPMVLLTSLRVSDSLEEHTSYFMAELKKLQRIIDHLKGGEPALVLVDEILRGTNSEDKTYGSEQFIRKLLQYRCLSLFATHDLSLGKLEEEKPGVISNYCFESVIEEGELHFSYLLQKGIARNRNASFLMKKMDII